ncbi:hypothetical protein JDV02_007367 [Purpureocillium takamizusanense]|uniref:Uncharacterized protein n=1 Tax=Purpureocillium takamizusanense TaxID=2060973 RepID=A0A9Q8QLE8_9HYPO|nr:uncharacterized protein JDV02_007367 [Purpureocillium takamizusanense]UNI21372.1 hypothetical protein JDV02_007367 [Purpureocillium takamizusanense]
MDIPITFFEKLAARPPSVVVLRRPCFSPPRPPRPFSDKPVLGEEQNKGRTNGDALVRDSLALEYQKPWDTLFEIGVLLAACDGFFAFAFLVDWERKKRALGRLGWWTALSGFFGTHLVTALPH